MKKAIVTGASEGLGFEIAKLMLDKGWEVLAVCRTKPELDVLHCPTDLTKEKDLDNLISFVKEEFNDFEALVNCAGVLRVEKPSEVKYKSIDKLFKINVLAPIYLTSKLMNLIKKNKADVLNIGSTIGFKAYENQASYGASKWAVRGLNEYLQLEFKGKKCRAIGFNPGGFKSRLFEKATGEEVKDWDGWMEPSELAKVVVQTLELPKGMEVSEIIINRK